MTIVGREAELAAIQRFLDALPEGPAALVVEGEAGIGKTTVLLEAIQAARARSFRVLRSRPAESEARLSYAALADLLDSGFEAARAALPAPQERALAAALLRADAAEAADPRTTATALVGVLAALASEEPVLVAVDDVQWLDPASARALEFAARRLPERVGLLVARRAEGAGTLPLGLDRSPPEARVERLVPGPLSLAALHQVVRSRLGTTLARPTLVRLAEVSSQRGRAPRRRRSRRLRCWRRRRPACSSPTTAGSGSHIRCSPPPSTDPRRPSGGGSCTAASPRSSSIRRSARGTWR